MALLKLKDLHSKLEYVDGFEDPKIELEQYITTSHIAGKLSTLIPGTLGAVEVMHYQHGY